jgi:hypothetical protein
MTTIKANYFDLSKAFIRIFYYHIITPLLGINLANLVLFNLTGFPTIEKLISSIGTSSYLLLSINFLSFSLISTILIYLSKLSSSPYRWIFITAFIFSSLLITFGALYGIPENRYTVVPNAILAFFILSNIKKENFILAIVLLGSITSGIIYYKHSSTDIYFKYEPNKYHYWVNEVQKWKKDNNYALNILPHGWTVTLPMRASLIEQQQLNKFNTFLNQQSAFKFNLSNDKWQTEKLNFPANSFPSNFILGMQLSIGNLETLFENKRLSINLTFKIYCNSYTACLLNSS